MTHHPLRFFVHVTAAVAAAVLIVSIASLAGSVSGPDRADVGRVLRFLSDDRLAGRASFTPGNEEAARFIAAEFAAAGLRPAPGSDSILSPFTVHRIVPESVSVTIDGRAVPPAEFFVVSGVPAAERTLSDSFPVMRMGATFERELFRRRDGLLLVPRSHAQMFGRFRRFLGGPRTTFDPPAGGVLAAVLTDDTAAGAATVSFRGRHETPGLANVVGTIPGRRAGEIVLFSAHYDHLGILPAADGDSIANGANDNASGTTALIALARRFAAGGVPERTLVFAALAAEEIGGFGARRLLSTLAPESVAAMINLEMLGTVSKFGPRTFWMTGYERSDLGKMMAAELAGTGFTLHPDPYPAENLFFRSDNAVFARAGVPAHTISTDPIDQNPVYHTVGDEADRLDVAHLEETIRGIALAVRGVVEGRHTPGRLRLE